MSVRALRRGLLLLVLCVWSFLLMFVVGAADAGARERLERRADAPRTSVEEVADGVMCPTCDAPLSQSDSPAAEQMRAWIQEAVDAGWTEAQIRRGLVREYGGDESILAVPDQGGAELLVWTVPAVVGALALLAGALTVRGWRRGGRSSAVADGHDPVDDRPGVH